MLDYINPSKGKFLGGPAVTNTLILLTSAYIAWKVFKK